MKAGRQPFSKVGADRHEPQVGRNQNANRQLMESLAEVQTKRDGGASGLMLSFAQGFGPSAGDGLK